MASPLLAWLLQQSGKGYLPLNGNTGHITIVTAAGCRGWNRPSCLLFSNTNFTGTSRPIKSKRTGVLPWLLSLSHVTLIRRQHVCHRPTPCHAFLPFPLSSPAPTPVRLPWSQNHMATVYSHMDMARQNYLSGGQAALVSMNTITIPTTYIQHT